ncbi:hypothetical protein TL16_g08778 [Triparma laevis f. inornata]|uniref:Uncharacterized protein n=2 Tax=Triparma laevis TaxID=1534972 RepID=A0A9W7KS33_9STRA|nr:hypothetical protein TL16_g08778 [Triparma laevis f. inornata]GMI09589.1 hypothetical protein TrLO_g6553 [Triparma laevis f. longispina]
MLALVQKKKDARLKKERKQSLLENARIIEKVFHPDHTRLERALLKSPILKCVHVEVKNESYWFSQRLKLGGKFHSVKSVTKDKNGSEYKAMCYELKRRESDYELAPSKKYLGLFKTSAGAFRACDNFCKERDANPGELDMDKGRLYDHPEEYFTEEAGGDLMKNFCVRGQAVNSLPFMRGLKVPFEVMMDLRTPSQYQPRRYEADETERLSKSRTGIRGAGIGEDVKNISKTKSLRETIAKPSGKSEGGIHGHFYHDMTDSVKSLVQEQYQSNMKLIKGDPEILESGVYKKTVVRPGQAEPLDPRSMGMGGEMVEVNGVMVEYESDEMKQAAAAMAAASEALRLGDDPTKAAEDAVGEWKKRNSGRGDISPKKKAEEMMKKKEAILGQKQVGEVKEGDGEADIITKYQVSVKRVAGWARRLQRIWRRRILPLTQRLYNRRSYSAILFQKQVRGYYAREYVGIFREVIGVGSTKIQALWRAVLGRRKAEEIRQRMTKFALAVQPLVRGWIGRTYARWLRENWKRAKLMQKVVRGFVHRRRFEKVGFNRLKQIYDIYAVRIQNICRGYVARKTFRVKIENLVFNKILIPSVIVNQRVYRGRLGRRIGFQKRLERDAAIELQRHCRGLAKRRWLAYIKWKKYERSCAVLLQSHFKGWIDREIMRRRRNKHYEATVVIPSILKMQSYYRGYVCRRNLAELKNQWFQATRIQGAYRSFVAMRLAKELFRLHELKMKGKRCTQIQRLFRGWWWRRHAYQKKASEAARRLYASRIIMRGWIRYRDGRRYRTVKEAWEVEQSAETLMDLDEERAEILEDLDDIELDIAAREKIMRKVNKRVKEILHFNEQVALRLPKVEWEVDNPGPKDITQGWYEAFQDEFERLHNQSRMAREEIRLCKCNLRVLQRELDMLWLEREDVQIDLDGIGLAEHQEFELLRRVEMKRADRRKNEEWEKRVRLEKNKWKVDDVRKAVIRKKRVDLDEIAKELKEKRSKGFVSTVSFWKRHDHKKAEKDKMKRTVRERRKEQADAVEKLGIKNEAIRHTFDAVISGTLDILKGGTMDGRHDKHDFREDEKAMCRICGRVYCECDQDTNPTDTYFHKVLGVGG